MSTTFFLKCRSADLLSVNPQKLSPSLPRRGRMSNDGVEWRWMRMSRRGEPGAGVSWSPGEVRRREWAAINGPGTLAGIESPAGAKPSRGVLEAGESFGVREVC